MSYSSSNVPPLPSRRLLIFEPITSGPPLEWGGISPLTEQDPTKPPQDIHDRKGETRRIVKRLLAMIEEHRKAALRMNFVLNAEALDVVLRALEAETCGADPAAILSDPDTIRSYLLTSVYEDLLAEPSNILFTTHVATDVVRYEAMEVAFWGECVAGLRAKLIL
jgi:hypothetical protein